MFSMATLGFFFSATIGVIFFLQVAVVVFSVARSVPLLFDDGSQAVATPAAVIVLQSSQTKVCRVSCQDAVMLYMP